MSIAKARLGTKLLLLSSAGLLSIALTAGVAHRGLRSAAATELFLAENAVPSLAQASSINDEAGNIRENQLNFVLVKTPQELANEQKDFEASKVQLGKFLADCEKSIDNDVERGLFDKVVTALGTFQSTVATTLAGARAGDAGRLEALQQFTRVDAGKAYEALGKAIDELIDYNMQSVGQAHKDAVASGDNANWTMVAIALAAALALGGFALWLTRGLLRQFGGEPADAAAVAQAVARGDLGRPITLTAGDTSSVMASLKAMQLGLGRTVVDVRRSAEGVATASAQIAQGNGDLSSRTEQQASALQQTAASMEQLGSTVKQNADNARQANQLALSASEVAVQGGSVVGEVVDTMKAIDQSSKRIVDIIGVIDGIAFQTNILALNAAVEAARAGEQGRGFAVVATEVRSLAQRSADAAKEIKTLIATSVERVEQGTALVGRAGSTMQEVVSSIRRVTDIMGEISSASSEQSAGVSQVGDAVSQMDQATQQNAALVEQSAAAAESLKAQAQQLVQAVAVFKVGPMADLAAA